MKFKRYHKSMQLDDSQMIPEAPSCAFCFSKDRIPVWVLQNNPAVTLLLCRNCDAVSASRMPTGETLSDFYNDYYDEKSYYGKGNKVTFDLTNKFAKHIMRLAARHLKQNKLSLLDFGGGDGSMAVQLGKELLKTTCSQIHITVVDYHTVLPAVDDDRIQLEFAADLADVISDGYHLVIASAVLEHLPEPGKTLARLLSLLKIDGLFYARTPYMLPFMRGAHSIGHEWDFHYPSHLHDLGPLFWNKIFPIIDPGNSYRTLRSQPSIVETSFRKHFLRTLIAYGFKLPWYLLGNRYKMVGGWEILTIKSQ
ncbi:MAG: class I SAM-dependent methyltransferase [Thermodesulfobacteriota bacterium]